MTSFQSLYVYVFFISITIFIQMIKCYIHCSIPYFHFHFQQYIFEISLYQHLKTFPVLVMDTMVIHCMEGPLFI